MVAKALKIFAYKYFLLTCWLQIPMSDKHVNLKKNLPTLIFKDRFYHFESNLALLCQLTKPNVRYQPKQWGPFLNLAKTCCTHQ